MTVKRWEYELIGVKPNTLTIDVLAPRGMNGWELVHVSHEGGSEYVAVFWFKRPIQDDDDT